MARLSGPGLIDALHVGSQHGDMAATLGQWLHLWEATGERLSRRCQGLSDEEFFWEPVPDCWNVWPGPAGSARWTYEYDFDPPRPHPVTTIAWRLVHISADNWIYWEHAFGDGVLDFPDLDVPHNATAALANWHESRRPITRWLRSASEQDLQQPRPSHLGADRTAGEVIGILLDEQIHHGAEIALLRDLYLRLARPPPATQ